MSDLRELYQEVILDHSKRPRNFRLPEGPGKNAVGYNPLCGDRLVLKLLVEDGVIRDAGFQGHGCAISTASASTMTEAVKGLSVTEAHALFHKFHSLLTGGDDAPDPDELGKLAVFSGVVEFPMRVKCATLAWHTLESALGDGGEVTTE